jgi:acyl dehydratase
MASSRKPESTFRDHALKCHQQRQSQEKRREGGGVAGFDSKFDPATFRVTELRAFDDLKVGETFRTPSRTVTEAHFAAFQVLSGDNHPIHYDVEYCKAQGHRGLLAHGLQVAAFAAIGAGAFPHQIGDKLIGFIEQSTKFLRGVYPGDTLYTTFTLKQLIPQRTTGVVVFDVTIHNQSGALVLSGEQKYLLRK